MKSTILTSAENVALVHQKAAEKQAKQAKQARKSDVSAQGPPKKRARRLMSTPARTRKVSSEEEEEEGDMKEDVSSFPPIHLILNVPSNFDFLTNFDFFSIVNQ